MANHDLFQYEILQSQKKTWISVQVQSNDSFFDMNNLFILIRYLEEVKPLIKTTIKDLDSSL